MSRRGRTARSTRRSATRAPRVVPNESDLRRAAEVLNGGEKVAILVGQGALGAGDEVLEVADRLGAGVAKALLGRAVVPDDLPFVTGSIGLLGTRPSYELMNRCDTLLMVGSSFPYSEFLPEEGQARGVQIDIDARRIGIRYPMDVQLVGDARETLRALMPLLAAQGRPLLAGLDRRRGRGLVAADGGAGDGPGRSDQPAARVLGALRTAARPLHPHRRLGLVGELVRTRPEAPRRDDGVALGKPRDDGAGRAVRDRGQVRAIPTAP